MYLRHVLYNTGKWRVIFQCVRVHGHPDLKLDPISTGCSTASSTKGEFVTLLLLSSCGVRHSTAADTEVKGCCGQGERGTTRSSSSRLFSWTQGFGGWLQTRMRFGYALSRLLGSVYGNGNVVFLPPEGTCILAPVRNRVVSWG